APPGRRRTHAWHGRRRPRQARGMAFQAVSSKSGSRAGGPRHAGPPGRATHEVTMRRQTTIITKPEQVRRGWYVVSAEGHSLGRLAAEVATVLMGKHRPEYTPHVDTGEFVVVTNASKVVLTGRKAEQRLKMRYTQYPGGLRTETYGQVRERQPEKLVEDA